MLYVSLVDGILIKRYFEDEEVKKTKENDVLLRIEKRK